MYITKRKKEKKGKQEKEGKKDCGGERKKTKKKKRKKRRKKLINKTWKISGVMDGKKLRRFILDLGIFFYLVKIINILPKNVFFYSFQNRFLYPSIE